MQNFVNGFRFRWFVENCCQIELPNGKSIVIDPIFRRDESQCRNAMEKKFICGFDDSVIERCDYILLTHVHFDHIGSLKTLQERFHCPILVNGWSAFELVKHLDLSTGSVIPMTDGCEYNFDEFRVLWQQARHTYAVARPSYSQSLFKDWGPEELAFGNLGTVYNSCFLLKFPNGQSIAMDGGAFEPHILEHEKYHPTLVLRHVERDVGLCAAQVSEELKRGGGPFAYILTMHLIQDPVNFVAEINEKLAHDGVNGRVVYSEPGRWLTFGMAAVAE